MQSALLTFIQELRQSKLSISTTEVHDAFNALSLVGLQDRECVKQILAMTLAKTATDKHQISLQFEQFFYNRILSEDSLHFTSDDLLAQLENKSPEARSTPIETPPVNSDSVKPLSKSFLGRMLTSGDQIGKERSMDLAFKNYDVSKIQSPLQRNRIVQELMEQLGNAEFQAELRERMLMKDRSSIDFTNQLQTEYEALQEELAELVDKTILLNRQLWDSESVDQILKNSNLSQIEKRYHPDLIRILRQIVQRLKRVHLRRKSFAHRGQLHMPKTLQHNLKTDANLFQLYWKRRKRDRPKVWVLCDVSHSVGTLSQFFLLFLFGLHEIFPKLRIFAFTSFINEISDIFQQESVEDAIAKTLMIHRSGISDYGNALKEFERDHLSDLDSKTLLILIGDGRCNGKHPHDQILKTLSQHCKRLIWLNPEPKRTWNKRDSEMDAYAPYCDYVEVCHSLQHIEDIFQRILRF